MKQDPKAAQAKGSVPETQLLKNAAKQFSIKDGWNPLVGAASALSGDMVKATARSRQVRATSLFMMVFLSSPRGCFKTVREKKKSIVR